MNCATLAVVEINFLHSRNRLGRGEANPTVTISRRRPIGDLPRGTCGYPNRSFDVLIPGAIPIRLRSGWLEKGSSASPLVCSQWQQIRSSTRA
jgi:hypothetical protein